MGSLSTSTTLGSPNKQNTTTLLIDQFRYPKHEQSIIQKIWITFSVTANLTESPPPSPPDATKTTT